LNAKENSIPTPPHRLLGLSWRGARIATSDEVRCILYSYSVLSRNLFSAIDDHDFHRPFPRFQLEAVQRNWALLGTGNAKELRSSLDQSLRVSRYPELLLQDAALRMTERDYVGARARAEEIVSHDPANVRAAQIATLRKNNPPKRSRSLRKSSPRIRIRRPFNNTGTVQFGGHFPQTPLRGSLRCLGISRERTRTSFIHNGNASPVRAVVPL
jgi:hypothetical protein